ncbi:hypothetical protein AaE_011359 [Aphanomyces astaci]|uniref:Uncharacterized protein n=1 Tax=Aphanomyces astaci TaxID=112090 RepID=A0A6A4ZEW4_APHAT|nr:hypothetical protein AaE_011359 [Aphanomyces astaci]
MFLNVYDRCGGHYRFEVWALALSEITLALDSTTSTVADMDATLHFNGWTNLKASGEEPSPRRHHSVTYLPNVHGIKRLLVFGGHAERFPFQSFNDVHICLIQPLDDDRPVEAAVGTLPRGPTWFEPEISGQAPLPRSGHLTTLITREVVAISGGSHGATPISEFQVHLLHIDDQGVTSTGRDS